MTVNELLTESFPGNNRARIYRLMVDQIGSGPFDGGCLVFARALQIKYGGEIVVLLRAETGRADHAAVKINDILIDADGPANPTHFIHRFEKNERVKIDGIRPIKSDDLPDAARNQQLSEIIAKLL
jgi:hypothetical protein